MNFLTAIMKNMARIFTSILVTSPSNRNEVYHSIHEFIAQINKTPMNSRYQLTSLRQKHSNRMFFY